MSFLQLKSNNPKFSYVIGKNPLSGMQVRSIRLGKAFGWYPLDKENIFNCYFKDSETEVSYKAYEDEKFEYLNITRYNSLMSIINMISSFFNATVNKDIEEDVEGFKNIVMINMINVKDKYIDIFDKVFPHFKIEHETITPNAKRITITTNKTVKELLHCTNLFCLFNIMANDREYLDISDDVIEKYMRFLDYLEAPFYIKHVFKINLLRSPKLFKKYKELLEKTYESSNEKLIKLVPGNSGMHRWDAIRSRVDLNNDIIDLGCGEGVYIRELARKQAKLDNVPRYYAIDINEDELSKAMHKARKYRLEHVEFFNSYDGKNSENKTFIDDAEYDLDGKGCEMLITEVIEHMELSEAESLLKVVGLNKSIKKYHITTPNILFNPFYQIPDNNFRHDDHNFELTPLDFDTLIRKCFDPDIFSIELYTIGDMVNNQYSTLGCEVRRK